MDAMSDSPTPPKSLKNSDSEKRSSRSRRQLADRRGEQVKRRKADRPHQEERRKGLRRSVPRRENDQKPEAKDEDTSTGSDWMMKALQEAEKRQLEMPAMAPPPVEIPKEGESHKEWMMVEETFRRRNLILSVIILVMIVALIAVIFF